MVGGGGDGGEVHEEKQAGGLQLANPLHQPAALLLHLRLKLLLASKLVAAEQGGERGEVGQLLLASLVDEKEEQL